MCAVQLIMFTAYVVHVRCQPFMSTSEFHNVCEKYKDHIDMMNAEKKRVEELTHEEERQGHHSMKTGARKSSHFKMGESSKMSKETREKNADALEALKKGVITKETAGAAAEAYLWNWNNVEANLLMSCVLVSVFGVMFETEYVQPGTYWYELLGNLVLVLVIVSLVYYGE